MMRGSSSTFLPFFLFFTRWCNDDAPPFACRFGFTREEPPSVHLRRYAVHPTHHVTTEIQQFLFPLHVRVYVCVRLFQFFCHGLSA
jgi:hypothetical protein